MMILSKYLEKKPIFPAESFQELVKLNCFYALQLGAGHLWWCPNGWVAYAPWPRSRSRLAQKSQGGFLTKWNGPWRLWNWTQDGCLSRIVALCPSPCLVAVDLHIKYQVWMKLTISSFGCPLTTPTRLLDMISSEVRLGRYSEWMKSYGKCLQMFGGIMTTWPPGPAPRWLLRTSAECGRRLGMPWHRCICLALPKHCKQWIVKGSIRFPSTKMNSLFFIHMFPGFW